MDGGSYEVDYTRAKMIGQGGLSEPEQGSAL